MIPKVLSEEDLKYFSRGKRSRVYTFVRGKKKFAVKVKSESSEAKGRLENEAKFLKILNEYDIGPRLVRSGNGFIVYEFVEGVPILEFLEKSKNPIPIIKKVLEQCRVMDRLKINKLEMHHPVKHVLVKGKKVTMIDFERCYYTKKPKNVTQFCQFLLRCKFLSVKGEKFVKVLKEYKKDFSEGGFKRILRCVQN